VDDKEIDMAMENMAANNHLDVDTLKSKLVAQGISVEDYRKRLKWQILQSKVINYEIRSKIVITEEKARQYYQQQDLHDIPDGYHILQIGLQWGNDKKYPTRDKAMTQARQLEQMLAEHQEFSDLARTYSDLPSAADGGDLGFFAKKELASFMKETILKMKPGETSQIIETSDNTLQILKLLSIKSGDTVERPPFESVKQEIIHKLQDEELDRQFARWLKDIRAQAYIKTIL
jgi:peptidyl-prolyl cis-trans isomerase SurA